MILPKHKLPRIYEAAGVNGQAMPFRVLQNVPNALKGITGITGAALTPGADLTANAFKILDAQITQCAVNITIVHKIIDLYNANEGRHVLGNDSALNLSEKPLNTNQIPSNINMPMGRVLFAYAMIWKNYSSDAGAGTYVTNNLMKMLGNVNAAYSYNPVIPEGASMQEVLKDCSAAANNFILDAHMIVSKYNGLALDAVADGNFSDNPLTTITNFAKWARDIQQAIIPLANGGNAKTGQNAADSNGAESEGEETYADQIRGTVETGFSNPRKSRPGWKQTARDLNLLTWEGVDGDGVKFTVSFTDDWQRENKKIFGNNEITPGVGYLLTLRMEGQDKKGRDLYATYVFDTDKDINMRRFPRDYIGAIETIIKEAVKTSIFKVADDYDFMRSWNM